MSRTLATDRAVEALAANTVTELNFEGYMLGSDRGARILEAVKVNTSLHTLNLNENMLTEKLASLVTECVEGHPVLSKVSYRFNKKLEASMDAPRIAAALKAKLDAGVGFSGTSTTAPTGSAAAATLSESERGVASYARYLAVGVEGIPLRTW